MRLEKRKVFLVCREPPKGYSKKLNVVSAFSTKQEAIEKLKWCEDTFTKGKEKYVIEEVETWFPTQS